MRPSSPWVTRWKYNIKLRGRDVSRAREWRKISFQSCARGVTVFRIRLRSCRVSIDKNIAFAKKGERERGKEKKTSHVRSLHSQVAPALHSTAGRSRCRARRVPCERDVAYFRHDVSREVLKSYSWIRVELIIIKTECESDALRTRAQKTISVTRSPYFWLRCQILKISIKTRFFVIVTRFGDCAPFVLVLKTADYI